MTSTSPVKKPRVAEFPQHRAGHFELRSPLNRDVLWKLISNMSLNYLSLADVNALKVILETYDFPRYYDEQTEKVSKRLLDGLKSIRHQHVDRLHRGLPVRGLRTELTIDPRVTSARATCSSSLRSSTNSSRFMPASIRTTNCG